MFSVFCLLPPFMFSISLLALSPLPPTICPFPTFVSSRFLSCDFNQGTGLELSMKSGRLIAGESTEDSDGPSTRIHQKPLVGKGGVFSVFNNAKA